MINIHTWQCISLIKISYQAIKRVWKHKIPKKRANYRIKITTKESYLYVSAVTEDYRTIMALFYLYKRFTVKVYQVINIPKPKTSL